MPDAFDPYHKWLGIAPEEQPPSHYRLLGIRTFESDPDVIETASDQRMLLLRTFQAGQHAEQSQQLLNQISAAKVCLLDTKRKAAYDSELRSKGAAQETQQEQPPAVQAVRAPKVPPPSPAFTPSAFQPGTRPAGRSRKPPWQQPAVLAIGGAGC